MLPLQDVVATLGRVAESDLGVQSIPHHQGLVQRDAQAAGALGVDGRIRLRLSEVPRGDQGIDQVAQASAQMEKVTQTTAATAEESAAASEELNAQAESALAVVRQLETMVGGAVESRKGFVEQNKWRAAGQHPGQCYASSLPA